MNIQEIEDMIQFNTRDCDPKTERDHAYSGHKCMEAIITVSAKVFLDTRLISQPSLLEEICRKKLKQLLMDKLYHHRYSDVAKAFHEVMRSIDFRWEDLESLRELRTVCLGHDSLLPPMGYKPEERDGQFIKCDA